jgi:hypothetical protein
MKRVGLLFSLLLLVSSTAVSQSALRKINLTIDGIGSGSSYADVLRKLGVPPKQNIERGPGDLSCAGMAWSTLTADYPGLQVVLLGNAQAQGFKVVKMMITSKKWLASSLRIGASAADVEKKFGKPDSTNEGDKLIYEYVAEDNLGGVSFQFAKGKLISISIKETLC